MLTFFFRNGWCFSRNLSFKSFVWCRWWRRRRQQRWYFLSGNKKRRRRFSVGSHFCSYSTPLADKRHERSEQTSAETGREHEKKCGKWYALRWLRHHGRIRKSRSFLYAIRRKKTEKRTFHRLVENRASFSFSLSLVYKLRRILDVWIAFWRTSIVNRAQFNRKHFKFLHWKFPIFFLLLLLQLLPFRIVCDCVKIDLFNFN